MIHNDQFAVLIIFQYCTGFLFIFKAIPVLCGLFNTVLLIIKILATKNRVILLIKGHYFDPFLIAHYTVVIKTYQRVIVFTIVACLYDVVIDSPDPIYF